MPEEKGKSMTLLPSVEETVEEALDDCRHVKLADNKEDAEEDVEKVPRSTNKGCKDKSKGVTSTYVS